MKYFIYILFFLFARSQGFSTESDNSIVQNAPLNITVSPLNNLMAFSVLPLSPPLDPSKKLLCDKVDKILHTKLSHLGTVEEMATNNPIGFGLSGVFLSFNIQKIESLDNTQKKLTQISLSIPTMVTLKKTKRDCISYIWTSSVFVENDEDASIERGITELLEQFSISYHEANSIENEKPTFYVYR